MSVFDECREAAVLNTTTLICPRLPIYHDMCQSASLSFSLLIAAQTEVDLTIVNINLCVRQSPPDSQEMRGGLPLSRASHFIPFFSALLNPTLP